MALPQRSRRRLFRALAALATAALVGGGIVAYLGYRETSGPDGAVKGYFAALRRGDAASALAFGNLPAGPPTLLTATVLREQQRLGPIRQVTMTGTRRDGNRAVVGVRYTIDFPGHPDEINDSVDVIRDGSSWRLAEVAVRTRLDLVEAANRASVVGAFLPQGEVLVFPGAAPVRLDSPYLLVDQPSTVVTFGSGTDTTINALVSPRGDREAKAAVIAALSTCLAPGADPRCPLPDGRAVPGSTRGTLPADVADQLSVAVGPDPLGRIEVRGTLRIGGSYTVLDFDNVPTVHRGRFTLTVRASAVAFGALAVTWSQASP